MQNLIESAEVKDGREGSTIDSIVFVSFHTVSEDELIEERPNPTDNKLTRQRRYLD